MIRYWQGPAEQGSPLVEQAWSTDQFDVTQSYKGHNFVVKDSAGRAVRHWSVRGHASYETFVLGDELEVKQEL
jgi:hypothetical protein